MTGFLTGVGAATVGVLGALVVLVAIGFLLRHSHRHDSCTCTWERGIATVRCDCGWTAMLDVTVDTDDLIGAARALSEAGHRAHDQHRGQR